MVKRHLVKRHAVKREPCENDNKDNVLKMREWCRAVRKGRIPERRPPADVYIDENEKDVWRKILVGVLSLGAQYSGGAENIKAMVSKARNSAPKAVQHKLDELFEVFVSSALGPFRVKLYSILYPDRPTPARYIQKADKPHIASILESFRSNQSFMSPVKSEIPVASLGPESIAALSQGLDKVIIAAQEASASALSACSVAEMALKLSGISVQLDASSLPLKIETKREESMQQRRVSMPLKIKTKREEPMHQRRVSMPLKIKTKREEPRQHLHVNITRQTFLQRQRQLASSSRHRPPYTDYQRSSVPLWVSRAMNLADYKDRSAGATQCFKERMSEVIQLAPAEKRATLESVVFTASNHALHKRDLDVIIADAAPDLPSAYDLRPDAPEWVKRLSNELRALQCRGEGATQVFRQEINEIKALAPPHYRKLFDKALTCFSIANPRQSKEILRRIIEKNQPSSHGATYSQARERRYGTQVKREHGRAKSQTVKAQVHKRKPLNRAYAGVKRPKSEGVAPVVKRERKS